MLYKSRMMRAAAGWSVIALISLLAVLIVAGFYAIVHPA
jgi:hypothetical protein